MTGALLRYRIAAWVVGTGLVILVLIGMPLKYFADQPTVVTIVGTAHGYLYMAYLLLTFDLGRRAHWPVKRIILLMLAGTIPFLSFVAERKATHWVREEQPERVAA